MEKNIWEMLPEGWHEVPFEKAHKILTSDYDTVKVVSILINEPVEIIRKSTDLATWQAVVSSCTFLESLPNVEKPRFPKTVLGYQMTSVDYYDKFDAGRASVGQIEDMKNYLSQKRKAIEDKDKFGLELYFDIYPVFCAIYLDPILNEDDYNYERATSGTLKRIKKEMDFTMVLNMGAFFLKKLYDSTNGSKKEYTKVSKLLRKLKRALTIFLLRLVSMLR